MLKSTWVVILLLTGGPAAAVQTQPTQAERDAWAQDPRAALLETSPCKKVTWLVETVEKQAPGQRPFRLALGWCGRGFIESVVSVKGDNAAKA